MLASLTCRSACCNEPSVGKISIVFALYTFLLLRSLLIDKFDASSVLKTQRRDNLELPHHEIVGWILSRD